MGQEGTGEGGADGDVAEGAKGVRTISSAAALHLALWLSAHGQVEHHRDYLVEPYSHRFRHCGSTLSRLE